MSANDPGTPVTGHRWYVRPVFVVADVHRAVRFYVDALGFTKGWHEADGAGSVAQVNHGECEIILTEERGARGPSRLFIELTAAGLAELRATLAARDVPHDLVRWGYDCTRVVDPDGNELLFPDP